MLDYIESIQLEPNAWKGKVPFHWSTTLLLKDPTGREWADVQLEDSPYLQVDHYDSAHAAWQPAVFLWRPVTDDMNFFWFVHRDYPLDEPTMGAMGGKYKLIDGRSVIWAGGWTSNEDHFRDVTGLDLMNVTVRVGQYLRWLYVRRAEVAKFIAMYRLPMRFIPERGGGHELVPDWFSPDEEEY